LKRAYRLSWPVDMGVGAGPHDDVAAKKVKEDKTVKARTATAA
jgi:hypothetical protein